ncbi:ABC transporter ATP-binding protein [Bacteroidetes/Chlorobi group bacterium ChocPot_Mid]|nr:MAG: ABC transporter ATP-binding protein [Bacteroidetes/Chlorobi group bacterium ChocPot_Mid]
MLEIRNISKSYGKLKVLESVDMTFNDSGIYSILGPNGSGKTTLIKTILGMVIPDKGEIFFDGIKINWTYNYRSKISYLPQIANFPDNLTGRELISMIKDIRNSNLNEEYLINLFDLKNHLDKNMKHLSGGTKQKLNVVLALMFDTPIIILDEPTAGLDPVALISFKKLIKELKKRGKIIILTTHIINLVEEITDKIIFLLEGNIYFKGNIRELLEKTEENNLEEAIAKILKENGNV